MWLSHRGALIALAVIGVALLGRVGFILATPHFRPYADSRDFDRVALSLARNGDYPPSTIAPSGGPSAFRPPAYPYLLAAVYRLTGTTDSPSRFTVARMLSATISSIAVGLIGVVALLVWGERAALVAAAVAAVYPPFVTIGDAMLAEPLFTALTLGSVAAALMVSRSPNRMRWTLLAGLLVGTAALTRTNGIIIAPAIAYAVWSKPRMQWRSIGAPAILIATTVLVLVPWCVRDALVFHRFVPVSTQTGFTLAGTYNDVSEADSRSPGSWRVPLMPPYNRLLKAGENEAVLDDAFQSQALHFAVDHPGYTAKVAYFNAGRLLELQGPGTELPAARESGISDDVSNLDVYSFYVLAAVALAAACAGGLRGAPMWLWLVPGLMALSLVFVIAYMRYRLPIDPFLILLAAHWLARLGSGVGRRRSRIAFIAGRAG